MILGTVMVIVGPPMVCGSLCWICWREGYRSGRAAGRIEVQRKVDAFTDQQLGEAEPRS